MVFHPVRRVRSFVPHRDVAPALINESVMVDVIFPRKMIEKEVDGIHIPSGVPQKLVRERSPEPQLGATTKFCFYPGHLPC
jgi:hypothetical protein